METARLTRRQVILGGLGLTGAALLNGCAGAGPTNFSSPAYNDTLPGRTAVGPGPAIPGAAVAPKRHRLEPVDGHILHGAGQSAEAFLAYTVAVAPTKPLLYMTYIGLKDDLGKYFDDLQKQLTLSKDTLLIPQIGLAMTADGQPEKHYEQDVAAGKYDAQIAAFCDGLAKIGRPAFVRVGYEFNGQWNGYKPDSYKAAWIRIAEAVRKHKLEEVALVWCYSPDAANKKYLDFYPGDAAVDWWSINLFSTANFTAKDTVAFLKEAETRKFPVMIGESTPQHIGVGTGDASWAAWYAPYFALLQKYPAIKAFCYINWNWSQYPQWKDWGDARISQNKLILAKYQQELAAPRYVHAAPAPQVREALGLTNPIAPPVPKLAAQTTTLPSTIPGTL